MKAIREGNLYFLESPFHFKTPSEDSADSEKRLSYLLGTVSARPAVVIRAPTWWDKFNTVTVIPALTKGKPAITYHLDDRYGHQTSAAYPFVPHNPHTIPVSRLGKYIGALEPEEFQELIYAFKWIHDPFMQADPKTYPVPTIYAEVVEKPKPASWKFNRDARVNLDLAIDKNLKIRSSNYPSLDGFSMGDALETMVPTEVSEDPGFVATTNPLPDDEKMVQKVTPKPAPKIIKSKSSNNFKAVKEQTNPEPQYGFIREEPAKSTETKVAESPVEETPVYGIIRDEAPVKPPIVQVVPVEKDFPRSTFTNEQLNEVAGRFDFSAAYFTEELKTRDPKYLSEEEIRSIRGNATDRELEDLFNYYRTLTPMDAYVLGPRLPTEALQKITGFPRPKTAILKRLCNVMRDIGDEDYDERVAAFKLAEDQIAAEKKAKRAEAKEERALAKAELAKLAEQIKPYLCKEKILRMTTPEDVRAFLALPMGTVKRCWFGAGFNDSYRYAKEFYKLAIRTYDQCMDGTIDLDKVKRLASRPDTVNLPLVTNIQDISFKSIVEEMLYANDLD